MIQKIDHIAIAVKDLESAVSHYRDVLGLTFLGTEEVPDQRVKVAMFSVDGVHIELLEPLNPESPISQFLEKKGGGIHHIAFGVDDAAAQIKEMEQKGVRMLNSEPRPGAHGSRIAFAHPKSLGGVLVEFCQKSG
ncbi:MAG TPA: methylmalonyl-CoA epimerase [Candidatus Aminicenantes bacterium]|nr:methylmalonyl-CoA epimerase [Candidatus Aminicenantes bacterium]